MSRPIFCRLLVAFASVCIGFSSALAVDPPNVTLPGGTYDHPVKVVLNPIPHGDTVRYTVDGTPVTPTSTVYTAPFTLATTTTVRAISYLNGVASTETVATYTITGVEKVGDTPTLSPAPGIFTNVLSVTMATATPGGVVHYTTDGTEPTETSPAYTAPVPVTTSVTIRARTFSSGYFAGSVAVAVYELQAAQPTISPAPGIYQSELDVALADATPSSQIYYTTDGSIPTTAATLAAGPIHISRTTTIIALAIRPGFEPSPVLSATYTLKALPPTIAPPGGIFSDTVTLALASPTPGAVVGYAFDGADATAASPTGTQVAVDHSSTVTTRSFRDGWQPSDATQVAVTIIVATPTASVPAGTYSQPQSVTLASTTSDTVIHYTLDGSTPTASSPVAAGPIAIDASATLKAIATRAGCTDSAVSTFAYELKVATPTLTPNGGQFGGGVNVTAATASPGASLTYAIGAVPDASSPAMPQPLAIIHDGALTVRGFRDGWTPSDSASASFSIFNLPPSFAKGPDQTVLEDAQPQSIAGWAGNFSTGSPFESWQHLTMNVDTDNAGLFSAVPSIDLATGTLNYQLAPNANGAAHVTVTLTDDGGVANGGSDTFTDSFVIMVLPVNDAPSFIKGPDVTAAADAGAQMVFPWATQISAGPADEAGQALAFHATVDHPELFAVAPAIAPDGTLTYTPAQAGTATVTVTLQDDGGVDNTGHDTSDPQTFIITLTAPVGGGGGGGDGGGGGGTPPNTPAVSLSITAGLTGDQQDTSSDEPVYFTNNSTVTIAVSATVDVGTIQSITVSTGDGQSLDCTSGSCSYSPSGEGSFELVATAVAVNDGLTAGGSSAPATLVHVTSAPTLSFSYLPPNTDPSGRLPMRTSLTSDADLVVLNGMSEGVDQPLREKREMNVFAKAGFTVIALPGGGIGLSQRPEASNATITGDGGGPIDHADPIRIDGQDCLKISGLPDLPDSIAYDDATLAAKDYHGRYTLHLRTADRCGNPFDADVFKLWVKTKAPTAKLATAPHLFQAHPTFQVASDNTTALIPARFIATSADAMDCFQESESKDNTMIKIVATTEGIPDAAPTGDARLSVWVLRRPLIPEDTPDEARLGLDPTWPMDATTVVVRDAAGNLSPLRPISAKLKLLTGDMPTTPDGTPAFPVTYAPLTQFLDEQPFNGDRTAWDLGYAKIWGMWGEGADLYNLAMAHSIFGVSPSVTEYLNGQVIFSQPQSPPPPAAYNPVPSPIMDLSEVRYATPLGIDPDGFGPRVMSVPPSWKTDPTNIIAVVRRDGLATPLTQPPSRQHYFITVPNPHTDPSDPNYSTNAYTVWGTWDWVSALEDNQSLLSAGYEVDPNATPAILDQGEDIYGRLGIRPPPATSADELDTRLDEVTAAPWSVRPDDTNTRQFTFSINRDDVSPGYQRFTFHRDGEVTTPLNANDITVGGPYTWTQTTIQTTTGGTLTTVLSRTDDSLAALPADRATTSTYKQETGFRWANFLKVENDVIATGATTLRLTGGFLSDTFQFEDFQSGAIAIHILDPDVYDTNNATYGVDATATSRDQVLSSQRDLLNATTSDARQSAAQAAVNAASQAVARTSAISTILTNASNDLSSAQSALVGAQGRLQSATTDADRAQAQVDISAAQARIDHDQIVIAAIQGPVDSGKTAQAYAQDAQSHLSDATTALANSAYYNAASDAVLAANAAVEAIRMGVSSLAEISLMPTAGQQYGSSVVAVTAQRLIRNGNNASLSQTLEVDLQIGTDVKAKIYDVDVKCGAVHEYSDELSQTFAGANGAHRMKGALAIMSIDFCRKGHSGERQPTRIVQQSDPAPSIDISEPSVGDVSIGSDGLVTVPLRGTIGDAIADIYQYGVADLTTAEIVVDDQVVRTVNLSRDSSYSVSGDESLWRPYAYQAKIDESVSFVGTKGTHHVQVRTAPNLFGNTSFQNIYVRIDEKVIPGSAGTGGGGSVSFFVHFEAYAGASAVDQCELYLSGNGSTTQSIQLTETAADSNIFTGVSANGPVTLRISFFTGLTGAVDGFTGLLRYDLGAGQFTNITLPFNETTSTSNLFTAAISGFSNDQGETRVPVCSSVDELPASPAGDFSPFLIRIKAPPEISLEGKKLYIPSQPELLPIKQSNGDWYATYPHSPPKVFYLAGKKGAGVNLYKPGDKAFVQIVGDTKADPSAQVFMLVVDRSYGLEGQGSDPKFPFIVHVFVEGVGTALKAGDGFTLNTPTAQTGTFNAKNEMKTASFVVPQGVGKYSISLDIPSIPLKGEFPDAFEIGKDRTLTVYLTFDDGPDATKTPHFLQVLKDKGILATFFVQTNVPNRGGSDQGAALMLQEFLDGHSVQIHTGSTADHTLYTALVTQPPDATLGGANLLESYLMRAHDRIIATTNQPTVNLARPPTGASNQDVLKSIQKLGLTQMLWEFDSGDNSNPHPPASQILKLIADENQRGGQVGVSPAYLAKKARNGAASSIVCLFHDINATTDANLVAYIEAIDKAIKSNGVIPVYAPMFEPPVPTKDH